ncbi:methyltransferase domain-containing protein [Phenylobacterium sp. LjRoot225]|uniref:class I SAM-dependent methyltransferase n=1 Tax=Phenylobacterium sp. LjRoot225 TaxID=3342285 RepID=UPI003ECDD125
MPTFLHVGSGEKRKAQTSAGFDRPEWSEIRLDIDPGVAPDVVSDMTDMSAVASASVEALFSSHNIEHLYIHQVPDALREFRRVLKPGGFAVIGCPDLQSMAALIAEDKLHEPAYQSRAGGITPHDTLYGFGTQLARGYLHMAHRCGFTRTSLIQALLAAGFGRVGVRRRAFELWAVATDGNPPDDEVQRLMRDYFPA